LNFYRIAKVILDVHRAEAVAVREQFSESVGVRRAQREVCKVFIGEDQRYRGIGKLQQGPRLLRLDGLKPSIVY
ncbi:MAG: hypothetical protein OEZ05_13920, partial [Nitrospirota bacterium]|nr:hypothetical protein [Nitrospirota bacterium]